MYASLRVTHERCWDTESSLCFVVFVLHGTHTPTSFKFFTLRPLMLDQVLMPLSFSTAPTHNLTLSRTAREFVELHQKLHDAHTHVTLPTLPLEAGALSPATRRKVRFSEYPLAPRIPSTQERLARQSSRAPAPVPIPMGTQRSTQPTPVASPGAELGDPFSLASPAPPATATATAMAAYLTTIANDQVLRAARVWKRFVRVRTDDLESVRVERAIKRVRSDLAAHGGGASTVDLHDLSQSAAPSVCEVPASYEPKTAATSSLGEVEKEGLKSTRFHETDLRTIPCPLAYRNCGRRDRGGAASPRDTPLAETQPPALCRGRRRNPSRRCVYSCTTPVPAPAVPSGLVQAVAEEDEAMLPRTPTAADPPSARLLRSQSRTRQGCASFAGARLGLGHDYGDNDGGR